MSISFEMCETFIVTLLHCRKKHKSCTDVPFTGVENIYSREDGKIYNISCNSGFSLYIKMNTFLNSKYQ